MRLNSAPLRFVVGIVGLWVGARAVTLTLPASEPAERAPGFGARHAAAHPPFGRRQLVWASPAPLTHANRTRHSPLVPRALLLASATDQPHFPLHRAGGEWWVDHSTGETLRGWALLPASARDTTLQGRARPLPGPVSTARANRWSGTAYTFLRQEGGAPALASGGQLGGSQFFARVAYQLPGPVALAARVYSPLETLDGAEAAVGADLHLLRGKAPLRVSVERRIALGEEARNAWSAYVAGGFYTAAPLGLEADGYAQAGVVGARRRDLFADGAVRLSHPVKIGDAVRAGVGVGAWGAAQPGVERLDIGPRASLSLPVADRSVVVNLDMRLRVAGEARPGSGFALTIGSDF